MCFYWIRHVVETVNNANEVRRLVYPCSLLYGASFFVDSTLKRLLEAVKSYTYSNQTELLVLSQRNYRMC
jgi:hypothetical protein